MTYYSRRQLEALGEPLGDSVTRKEGGRIIYGGGGSGGGGGPTQTTTYSTNIPEYARPYVENMLESTQKQIYTDDMGGFRPYKPYSTDVNNYFAGFSPLQQSAQQAAYNLQTPGQYGAATNLAGASGLGAFGVAQQAMGAGQQFAQQAQDPTAMQGYMSPYMQNVVDYQKSQALRDFNIGRPMRARQAIGAGAFGGSRQAIMEAEAERSLGSQLQGIAATGSQKAFEDAQRQQQFGAQLGMQGLQTGLQGYGQMGQAASTLGQLGGQQLGAQKEIIGLQSQMGREQQALEQNKINQAIQDYAIAQQYPFMQLGMMNAMLRGLPLQTQTTQLYQAQPSALQQGIGLVGAGSTLFGGRAAGGAIKEYREGGIASVPGYKYGKLISEPKLESMADDLTIPQLQQRLKDPALTPGERQIFAEALQEKMQQEKGRMSGIAMAGGPAFDSMGMAGGGIIAFAGEGPSLVEDPQFGGFGSMDANADQARLDQLKLQKDIEKYEFLKDASPVAAKRMLDENPILKSKVTPAAPAAPTATAAPKPDTKPPATRPEGGAPVDRGIAALTGVKSLEQQMAEQERLMGPNTANEGLNAKIAERLAGMSKKEKQDELAAIRRGFIEFGTTASPAGMGVAALRGIGSYGEASDAAKKAREGMDLELTKMQADIKKAERAEKRGNLDAAAKSYENAENRQLRIAEMQNQLKVANISASRSSEFERQYAAFKDNPVAFEKFRKSLTSQDDTARLNAYVKADDFISKAYPNLMFSKKPEDMQKLEQLRNAKVTEYLGAIGMASQGAPTAPQAGPDGTINIPGKGTFKQLPNGNYVKV
jgi:hypothetical protein